MPIAFVKMNAFQLKLYYNKIDIILPRQ